MNISANKSVKVEYELFLKDKKNEEVLKERATAEQPLSFIYGVGMMLPEFENHLEGLAENDTFDFSISADLAYGEYSQEAVMELEHAVFEVDGKMDTEMIYEGNTVPLMDNQGNRLNAVILSISDTHVKVDLNHPLAGEDLHFVGKILDVHEATQDEIDAIFGKGCGCDGCGSSGCGDGGCGDGDYGCGDDNVHGHGGCGCGCE